MDTKFTWKLEIDTQSSLCIILNDFEVKERRKTYSTSMTFSVQLLLIFNWLKETFSAAGDASFNFLKTGSVLKIKSASNIFVKSFFLTKGIRSAIWNLFGSVSSWSTFRLSKWSTTKNANLKTFRHCQGMTSFVSCTRKPGDIVWGLKLPKNYVSWKVIDRLAKRNWSTMCNENPKPNPTLRQS